jgi:hypothetical protein
MLTEPTPAKIRPFLVNSSEAVVSHLDSQIPEGPRHQSTGSFEDRVIAQVPPEVRTEQHNALG